MGWGWACCWHPPRNKRPPISASHGGSTQLRKQRMLMPSLGPGADVRAALPLPPPHRFSQMGCDLADHRLRPLKDPPLPSGHTQAPIALAGPGCLSSSAFAPQGPTTPPLSASDLHVPRAGGPSWMPLGACCCPLPTPWPSLWPGPDPTAGCPHPALPPQTQGPSGATRMELSLSGAPASHSTKPEGLLNDFSNLWQWRRAQHGEECGQMAKRSAREAGGPAGLAELATEG